MTISQLHIIYVMVYTFVMGYLFGVSAYLLISKRNGFGSETLPSNRIRRAGGLCVLMLALSYVYSIVSVAHSFFSYEYQADAPTLFFDILCCLAPMMWFLMLLIPTYRRPLIVASVPYLPVVVALAGFLLTAENIWRRATVIYVGLVWVVFLIDYWRRAQRFRRVLNYYYSEVRYRRLAWVQFLIIMLIAQMSFYLMAYVFNFPGGLFFSAAINVLMATTMVWYADHHKVSLEIEQDYEAYQTRLRTLRSDSDANADDASSDHPSSEYAWIGARLEQYCKGDELYLQPDLTLDSLAHQIDTNRTYLSRYFSYVGTTYYHYINQLRIDYAVKLIHADPDINLNEIARNSGYSNGTSFRRAFAERVGCLPSEYRDRLAGKTDF
ncbi:MAG: helix-turn-helix transcriptional regulator [Bacteroidaceae bacterium]|nr:helix-turn-helix transcriptional regulator [Bacteroidaceae bacterium]